MQFPVAPASGAINTVLGSVPVLPVPDLVGTTI